MLIQIYSKRPQVRKHTHIHVQSSRASVGLVQTYIPKSLYKHLGYFLDHPSFISVAHCFQIQSVAFSNFRRPLNQHARGFDLAHLAMKDYLGYMWLHGYGLMACNKTYNILALTS